jgi:hypothetical protein
MARRGRGLTQKTGPKPARTSWSVNLHSIFFFRVPTLRVGTRTIRRGSSNEGFAGLPPK